MAEEHDALKEKATAWLEQRGFSDIVVEPKIAIVGEFAGNTVPSRSKEYGPTLSPDIVGRDGARKLVVECGSIMETDRLYVFRDLGFEVYLWPYDADEPFLWSENVGFCRFCGRRFEHLKRAI